MEQRSKWLTIAGLVLIILGLSVSLMSRPNRLLSLLMLLLIAIGFVMVIFYTLSELRRRRR